MTSQPAVPDRSGTGGPAGTTADGAAGGGPAAGAAARIAALTSQLIGLGFPAGLTDADQAELDSAVAAQVAAGLALRRYPLANSDEPMLVNDPDPGGPR